LKRAIADYTQVIQLDPQESAAYNNRGLVYAELGDLMRAIADYTQAIQLDPQYAIAFCNRGVAYDYSGDVNSAIADYTQAIQLDPQFSTAYSYRGESYQNLGNYTKAMKDYDKAVSLTPDDPDLLNNVAYGMVLMNIDLQKALEYINQSLEIQPDDPDSLDTQAFIYYKLGEYDKALQVFNYLIEKKQFTYSYYGRGLVYEAMGEKERAVSDLRLFLAEYPDDSQSEDARKRLQALGVTP
jgi:tetratricopeptide (TPR) repeat protein